MTSRLTLSVSTEAQSSPAVLHFLREVVDDFVRALSLGFFGPGVPEVQVSVQPASRTIVHIHVDGEAVNPAAVRVLRGMCEWEGRADGLPLRWLGAVGQGIEAPPSGNAPALAASGSPPGFLLARPAYLGFGEPFVVVLEFSAPADDAQIALIESGLATWTALLRGGLPPDDGMPGESDVGATAGTRIGSTTYQWFVEAAVVDAACIDLLVRFLEAHSLALRLTSVTFEA